MGTKGIKRDSLSKQVSDRLEKMIEDGKYPVGKRIPTETELMEMFEVSRNTVREAVQSLTWAGVLEVKQGDGTYVRSADRFHANMNKKYAEVSIPDIKEARKCIEVTIVHLAALRCEPEDALEIKEAFHKRNTDNATIKEYTKADMEFHMSIARACHNVILIDLYKSISAYLESHITERNLDANLDFDEIERLHMDLYHAVVEKNPNKAAISAKKILKI